MRDLKSIVNDYLSKETDYSIQIVGNWGYGKTYYYKNALLDLIISKECHSDARKKYKPIYVSLFGLKSTEEIATKIVFDFYQSKLFKDYFKSTEKKRSLKITQGVMKIGFRGFLNFKKLGSINDYLTDIKHIGENVLDANELVICIDDLERKDTALKIEDLTGYINSLVDEGTKVLIISNEDLLLSSGDQYKNLKEKIIGISVEFIPETRKTIDSIIASRYSGFPTYISFLKENFENIIRVSNFVNNNFRHLIYALDVLHHCYSELKKNILDTRHEISSKLLQEMSNISTLVLALAVEYKSSALKYNDLKKYSDEFLFMHRMMANPGEKSEEQKSTLELFLEKYEIQISYYRFYKTIFNYVSSYEEFDVLKFTEEFQAKFHLNRGKVLPQYEVLNSLNYNICFKLSDQEYEEKTLQAISYAKQGLYFPAEYYTVMHYAERLDNILNLELGKVRDELILGLKFSINNLFPKSEREIAQFDMSGRQSDLSINSRELRKVGMEEVKLLKEARIVESMNQIVHLLLKDPDVFQEKFQSDNSMQTDLAIYPFLNYVVPENLIELVKSANSDTIFFLRHFLKDRYESETMLRRESLNIQRFSELLANYREELLSMPGSKLRHFVVNEFAESLNRILENHLREEGKVIDSEGDEFDF